MGFLPSLRFPRSVVGVSHDSAHGAFFLLSSLFTMTVTRFFSPFPSQSWPRPARHSLARLRKPLLTLSQPPLSPQPQPGKQREMAGEDEKSRTQGQGKQRGPSRCGREGQSEGRGAASSGGLIKVTIFCPALAPCRRLPECSPEGRPYPESTTGPSSLSLSPISGRRPQIGSQLTQAGALLPPSLVLFPPLAFPFPNLQAPSRVSRPAIFPAYRSAQDCSVSCFFLQWAALT